MEARPFVCNCGCGRTYSVTHAIHEYEGFSLNCFAVLLKCEDSPKVWLSFLLGGWPGISDDCYVALEVWRDGGNVASRVAEESPFRSVFPSDLRQVTRQEALADQPAAEWLFGALDFVTEVDPPVRGHLRL